MLEQRSFGARVGLIEVYFPFFFSPLASGKIDANVSEVAFLEGVPLFGYYLLPTFGARKFTCLSLSYTFRSELTLSLRNPDKAYVLLLALASQNVAGSTKKSISTGAIFVGYNVGNIAAPYTVFTTERAEKYRSTWIAIVVSMGVTMVLSLVLRVLLAKENRDRDEEQRREREGREKDKGSDGGEEEEERVEREDLTDFENRNFRYSL